MLQNISHGKTVLQQTTRILVVDDDARLRRLTEEYLQNAGFTVTGADDGAGMHRALERGRFDLIILDIMLPDTDGLTLAREIRADIDCPIIMLSARGEDVDRIIGLEVGADDYLAKPFNPRELLARIRAVLRRKDNTAANQPPDIYLFGPFRLNYGNQTLKRDGTEIGLTTGEFNLLRFFTRNANRVLSRDAILQELKGYDHNPMDRSVDVQITRLRRKIEPDPGHPTYIRTIRGAGYLFSPAGGGP